MSLISRYEHLPNRPLSDEARPLLEKIASQVKPIMTKRGWKVGTLAEFFPANPALLGLNTNSGQKINLRLRPPGSPASFYEYDQLVLVMLHELTHNEIGPHNPAFYKLLGELEEEYYELKRKGYSGEGFNSTGNHLPGLRRSEYDGRRAGLAAAQKRLDTQLRMGKGGRLGGSGTSPAGKSMREIIAEATERRVKDDLTCATDGHEQEAREEVKRAEKESVGEDVGSFVPAAAPVGTRQLEAGRAGNDMGQAQESSKGVLHSAGKEGSRNQDDDEDDSEILDGPSIPVTAGPSRSAFPPASCITLQSGRKPSGMAQRAGPPEHSQEPPATAAATPATPIPTEWACPICTLLNPLSYLQCGACDTERPAEFARMAARTARSDDSGRSTADRTVLGNTASAAQGEMISDESGWYCSACSSGPRAWEFWVCEVCETVRKFG